MGKNFEFDVLLSHSSKDKPRVRKVAELLRAAGLKVWFDEQEIAYGEHIYLAVERGLEQSRILLLFLSKTALQSDWVGLERSTALFRDPVNTERRFVPVLLEDCDLPDTLKGFKYVDFRTDTEETQTELVAAAQGKLGAGGFVVKRTPPRQAALGWRPACLPGPLGDPGPVEAAAGNAVLGDILRARERRHPRSALAGKRIRVPGPRPRSAPRSQSAKKGKRFSPASRRRSEAGRSP